jgi:hypothetical protein
MIRHTPGRKRDLVPHDRSSVNTEELAEASLEEIELWLCACLESVNLPDRALTDWECEFIKSIDVQYVSRVNRGFTSPLSMKQLIRLRMLFNKLANDAARIMAKQMGNL